MKEDAVVKALMAIGLLGLLPGIAVNGHLWWLVLPIGESFGWAQFLLGSAHQWSPHLLWRLLFLLLAATIILAWPKLTAEGAPRAYRRKYRFLFALPLVLVALHPADRMGTDIDYEKIYNANELVQQTPDPAPLHALQKRQNAFYGIIDWLPPWTTSAGWVAAKYDLAVAAQQRTEGNSDPVAVRIQAVEAEMAAIENQPHPVVRFLDIDPLLQYQNNQLKLPSLREQLTRLQAEKAYIESQNLPLRNDAKPAVVGYYSALDTHTRWIEDKQRLLKSAAYAVSSLLVAYLFLFHVGVYNGYFAGVFAFSFLASLANMFPVWASSPAIWVLASLYPIGATLLVFVGARFVMRIWIDNQDIYAGLPKTTRSHFWRRSWVLILPFVLGSIGLVYAGDQVSRYVWSKIYCNATSSSECLNFLGEAVYNSDFHRNTRRDDLHTTIDATIVRLEVEIANRTADGASAAEKSISRKADAAREAFVSTFKANIWDYGRIEGPQNCFRAYLFGIDFNPRQCVYNLSIRIVNGVYQDQRNRLQTWYNRQVDRVERAAAQATGSANDVFQEGIDGISAPLAREAKKYTDFAMLASAGWGILGFCILVMVCGRAFATIQGRLHAHARPRGVLSVVPPEMMLRNGGAKIYASKNGAMEVPASVAANMVVNRLYDPDNGTLTIRFLPYRPAHFLISRLWTGCYWLRGIKPTFAKQKVKFTTDKDKQQFVRVNLSEHSAVSFQWKDFIAASDTIRFERLITLRISFAAFGYLTRPVAKGQGTLILRTRGLAMLSTSSAAKPSVEPYRVTVFSLDSKFALHSSKQESGIYFEEVAVTPASGANAALDIADSRRGSTGVVRQFVRLFVP